jgi:hypothetical protein
MMAVRTLTIFAFCWLLSFGLSGCGGNAFPIAPVSGKITLDGKPLAGARIGFEPQPIGNSLESGPGSYAKTDEQGRYTLKALNGQEGAVVTTHDIWIRTFVAKADRGDLTIAAAKERVPARYNDSSTLTFTVPEEGTDAADFALTSKAE